MKEEYRQFKRPIRYSDRKDYSSLKPNIREEYPHLDGCVECGEKNNVTITDDKDVCHECGYVYT
jgi:hypothetical protein